MRNIDACGEAAIAGEPELDGEDRGGVKAAATASAVLKGLAALGGRASLAALADHLRAHPAKLHRYLKSLAVEGLVARDPVSQTYALGPEAILVGLAALRQSDPIRAAEPALARLRDELSATAFLALPGNLGPTIVRLEEPENAVVVNVRPGFVLSLLWSATGRVLLATSREARFETLARAELAAAPAKRRALLPEPEPIAALARAVRADGGIATVRDLYLEGVSAAAAPVFDFTAKVQAILTVLGPTGRFSIDPDGPAVSALRREAAAASTRLGWQPDGCDRALGDGRATPPRRATTTPLGSGSERRLGARSERARAR